MMQRTDSRMRSLKIFSLPLPAQVRAGEQLEIGQDNASNHCYRL